jgi:DNA modification methylase
MRKLLERGTVNTGKRPSQHHISPKSFRTDNGGAIPPNVLVEPEALLSIPNTASCSPYRRACRAKGVTPHPACMPEALVEFFVRFLTEPGDVVLDPFAGSNTTGAVAEEQGRKWLAVEADAAYAAASRIRFGNSLAASQESAKPQAA